MITGKRKATATPADQDEGAIPTTSGSITGSVKPPAEAEMDVDNNTAKKSSGRFLISDHAKFSQAVDLTYPLVKASDFVESAVGAVRRRCAQQQRRRRCLWCQDTP